MMLKIQHLVVLLAITLGGVVHGTAQGKLAEVVVRGITVLDPASGTWLPNRDIVIRGTRIESVRAAGEALPPAKTTVNGAGKFAIPGLFDNRVNLSRLTEANAGLFVAYGVTSVRDAGTAPARIAEWRRAIDYGVFMGPRIVSSEPAINAAAPPATASAPGAGLHDQLQGLVSSRRSPGEVLREATIGSAAASNRERDLGSIEPGKIADLIVLERDPLADIANTRAIDAVIYRGEVLTRAHLNLLLSRGQANARSGAKQ